MVEHEAFQLLTLASARDGRTVSASVARVWASDLSGIALPDAVAAVQQHFRESTDWLLPAHVVRNVARLRESRLPLRSLEASSRECSSHAGYPLPCLRCEAF